ncbi:MAG: glycosyltransferase family 2 protein [Clostridia bacterium]|nr:glycosyltransferase family 2 protein [Clostridia bacterium]
MCEIKATVIVPVYNTPNALLDRCFASLKHCGQDIQIIAVDDGSAPETAAYLDTFQNIQVYHKPNGGVSSARNFGLSKAAGAYVFFLDADDTVTQAFPYAMLALMEERRLDVLISDITILPDGRTEHTGYPKNAVMPGKELAANNVLLFSAFDLCYSVRMGFSLPFLRERELKFRTDMTVSEDMVFNMQAIAAAGRVMAVGESYYEYRLDYAESATRKKYMSGYTDSMAREYETAAALFAFNGDLARQLAAFYMDFVFYNVVRNEKNGGALTYARYAQLCEKPMFRESIQYLGANHPCENAKAQLLYRLRYHRKYRLPYQAAVHN